MKLSASFLLITSTLTAAVVQAHPSLRRELAPINATDDDAAFNATDDDAPAMMMPEEGPALADEPMEGETTATSSTVGSPCPMGMDEPTLAKPDDNETFVERSSEFFEPENNTIAEMEKPAPPNHEKPERNDTMMTDLMFQGDNETLANVEEGPKHGLKHEANSTMAGPPGPKGFQDLVDDKCATFVCPSNSNSTCPSPPGARGVNGTDDKKAPPPSKPEFFDMNMTDDDYGMAGPPEPLDMNMTGPDFANDNMTEPKDGPSPKHSGERSLKPHHKPEDLLACACCEGATVEEIAQTGVDTSGLAFLVGYDPSAATVYDNGSSRSLNSLVVSSVIVGGAVLALFL